MPTNQPRIKPLRLLLLFGIVNVGLFVLAFVVFAFSVSLPTLSAIGWHLRHGRTFTLEGHLFYVPLTWDCKQSAYKAWALSKDPPFNGGFSTITLSSTGLVQNAAAIQRLNERQMSSNAQYSSLFTSSTETIHGKSMTFACLHLDTRIGETLFCRVPDTDISISVSTSANYRAETRAILETSN